MITALVGGFVGRCDWWICLGVLGPLMRAVGYFQRKAAVDEDAVSLPLLFLPFCLTGVDR